MAVRKAE